MRIQTLLLNADRWMERAVTRRLPPAGSRLLHLLLAGLVLGGAAIAWNWPGAAGLSLLFPLMAVCFFRGPGAAWLLLPLVVFHHLLQGGRAEDLVFLTAGLTGVLFSTVTTYKYRQARARELRLREDLSHARQIQEAMQPEGKIRLGPLELAVHARASRQLGGDFLCRGRPGPGRFGILLGDVMGKGTQAALTAALLDGVYSELSLQGASPKHVLTEINRALVDRFGDSVRMATLVCVEADTVNSLWRYSRAGHPPPLLVRASGEWQLLEASGILAGVVARPEYIEETAELKPGDQVLLVTDGLVVSGYADCEELAGQVIKWSALPVDMGMIRLVESLRRALPRAQDDDETAALVRYSPGGPVQRPSTTS